MTVEAIKEAIAGLPEDDRHSLAVWLNDLDYDGWDRQMVSDFSPGGRGKAWAERVKRRIAEPCSGSVLMTSTSVPEGILTLL